MLGKADEEQRISANRVRSIGVEDSGFRIDKFTHRIERIE